MAANDDNSNNSNNIDFQALTSSLLRSPEFQNAIRSAINSQTIVNSNPSSQTSFENPLEERRNLFPYGQQQGRRQQQGRTNNINTSPSINNNNNNQISNPPISRQVQQRHFSPYSRNTTTSMTTNRGGRYRSSTSSVGGRHNFMRNTRGRHNRAGSLKPPYNLKEVILLTNDSNTIIRAPKKAELSGKG